MRDIWAIGEANRSLGGSVTLIEHWDGTSWRIVNSQNGGNFQNGLLGVDALSDGTVVAVGFQEDQGFDAMPLILEN